MAQTRLLTDLLRTVERGRDLERQRRRLVEHDDRLGDDLNRTRRKVGVLVAVGAGADDARHLQDELGAQRVRHRLITDHHLGNARGIAQVDKRDATVVTAPVDPARESDGLTNVLGPKRAGGVCAEH